MVLFPGCFMVFIPQLRFISHLNSNGNIPLFIFFRTIQRVQVSLCTGRLIPDQTVPPGIAERLLGLPCRERMLSRKNVMMKYGIGWDLP